MTEQERLNHIAELAHNGGLADLNESDVLRAIRRLTLCYWPRTSDSAAALRVCAAIAASNSPTIHHRLEARTALAQPEPEGVTDEEIAECLIAAGVDAVEGELLGTKRIYFEGWYDHAIDGVRAAIAADRARYTRPTIKPVPVSERPWEREGWCDKYGMCWRFDPCDRGWWSYGPILPSDGDPALFTYLLPHHALPVPGAEVG